MKDEQNSNKTSSSLPKRLRPAKTVNYAALSSTLPDGWYETVQIELLKVKVAHATKDFKPVQIKLKPNRPIRKPIFKRNIQ